MIRLDLLTAFHLWKTNLSKWKQKKIVICFHGVKDKESFMAEQTRKLPHLLYSPFGPKI